MFHRALIGLSLSLGLLVLVAQFSEPARAQTKDNKKDKDKDSAREAQLERQLKAAQNEVNQLEKQLAQFKQQIQKLEQENNKLTALLQKERKEDVKDNAREAILERQLKALQQDFHHLELKNRELLLALSREKRDDKTDDARLRVLQGVLDGYRNAGVVHVVVLNAKSDTPRTAGQAVIDDVHGQLAKLPTVRGVWAGAPAPRSTPSFGVAVAVVFDDAQGLRRFLDDPVHKQFVERHFKKWETPVVYDFEPKR